MSSSTLKNGHHRNGSADGRDANGRFAPGNALGRGNPFARRVAALRRAFFAGVRRHDLTEIARTLAERAKAGDAAAAKLLLGYVLGKPAAAVDPDALDQDVWRRRAAAPTTQELSETLVYRMPFDVAATIMARTDAEHRRDAAPLSAPAKPKPAAISPRSISAGRLTSVLGASKGGARGNGHAARSESRRDGRK